MMAASPSLEHISALKPLILFALFFLAEHIDAASIFAGKGTIPCQRLT